MKSESEVSKLIQSYLDKKDLFWWRSQVYNGRTKSGGFLRTGIEGLADITVMLQGCHLYIEVKAEKGRHKQTDEQKDFQNKCRELGHHYMIARSVDDVELQLKRMGIIEN